MRVLDIKPHQFSVSPTIILTVEFNNKNVEEEILGIIGKIGIFIQYTQHYEGYVQLEREYLTSSTFSTPRFKGNVKVDITVPITGEMDVALLLRFRERKEKKLTLAFAIDGMIIYYKDNKLTFSQLPQEPPIETIYDLDFDTWNNIIRTFYGADIIWIKIRRDVLEKLEELKRKRFYPSYSEAIEDLIKIAEKEKENV
ncbi:hypothetical protein DJ521_05440 [Sulfolobus sp. E3]|nr:hypothetical protein DJ521_05440 [Sulfolobus sp. E3]